MNASEDPYEVLGVTPEDDERTIRKAYLRAIKKAKPETDPVGFARIRAAYEAVEYGAAPTPAASTPDLVLQPAHAANDSDEYAAEHFNDEMPTGDLEADSATYEPDEDRGSRSFEALEKAEEAIRNNDVDRAQHYLRECWDLSDGGDASSFHGDRYAPFVLSTLKELWQMRGLLSPEEFCQLGRALFDQDADVALNAFNRIERRNPVRWSKVKKYLEGPGARLSEGLGVTFDTGSSRGGLIGASLFLAFSMYLLYFAFPKS